MSSTQIETWTELNQRYLLAALDEVRSSIEGEASSTLDEPSPDLAGPDQGRAQEPLRQLADSMEAPPALESLCQLFNLSPFERATLLMCAGVELDTSFATLCASAVGASERGHATFSLALAALPDAHWSALSPEAPLRRWRLLDLSSGDRLTTSPLRIDERVLHYLAGVDHMDDRLTGLIQLVETRGDLVPTHEALARQIVATWTEASGKTPLPVVHLNGIESEPLQEIAAAACWQCEMNVYRLLARNIPTDARELDSLVRLWQRELLLSGPALLLDCHDWNASDASRTQIVAEFVDRIGGAVIVTGRERLSSGRRAVTMIDVPPPTSDEQRSLWHTSLGDLELDLNGHVDRLVAQFRLSPSAIESARLETISRLQCESSEIPAADAGDLLWDICRVRSRPRLNHLAQRIDPAATWDDLVLPPAQEHQAREIAAHVRGRLKVYETWGFAAKSSRGLGITALFSGPSGTGKTMTAEVLANHLRLDLYRIDLSQVVSKYIGETEKNLRQVFDAAEGSGAILLFDEADALFGKRSDVKDSHDRYANVEISYLLQRMEDYRGLAILTTNLQDALDTAFLRRIRFIIRFPFPDATQRAEIWNCAFPAETPTEGLDAQKLSRLNIAGGNIRNIAMSAAFLAADANEPVRMKHLCRGAQMEFAKLEKPLTGAEIGDW